jgi:hypothetical protein
MITKIGLEYHLANNVCVRDRKKERKSLYECKKCGFKSTSPNGIKYHLMHKVCEKDDNEAKR